MQTCDLIVIGASAGGQALALHAARAGQRVILFERDPDHAATAPAHALTSLLEITRLLRQAQSLSQAGVTMPPSLDLSKLMAHARQQATLPQPLVEHAQMTLIRKEASFTGKNTVTDGKEHHQAPRIVIGTGRSHALPEHVQGIGETPFLTPQSLMNLTELPARIAILGAGRTGVTLAQAMATLGSQAHLLDRADRILPNMPATIAQPLMQALSADGVELHLGASVSAVSYRDKRFTLRCTNDAEVIADALLLATGSTARTAALNARLGTLKLDAQGQLEVNPKLETSVPGVYAIGSCTDQPAGQASSWEDAQRLIDLWSNGTRYLGDRPRSYAVLTRPQAGCVGLSRDEAELAGYRIAQLSRPVPLAGQDDDGFIELLIDQPSGKLLGASIVAPEATQTLAALSLLIALGRTWKDLLRTPLIEGTLLWELQAMARQFDSNG